MRMLVVLLGLGKRVKMLQASSHIMGRSGLPNPMRYKFALSLHNGQHTSCMLSCEKSNSAAEVLRSLNVFFEFVHWPDHGRNQLAIL